MLTFADVAKSFRGHRVLDGVSLTVQRGEVVVVKGANGAGKSTLFDVACGVLDADRGRIEIDGRSVRDGRARALVGYAPAAPVVPEHLFLHEWIDLVASLRNASPRQVDEIMERWGLERCTDTRLNALSLGQRRRVALAAAELGSPDLLVLDEPTVGLDHEARSLLATHVRTHVARGGAALLATHEADLADALATRTLALHGGRLHADANA